MGLLLLDALQGDAALIVQEENIQRIAQPDGVEYLLHKLRALEEKQVQSLGGAMRLYEGLRRQQGEGIRSFVARWLAAEAHLSRLGLGVYTGEARAHKFLSACNLVPGDYRMILTATVNTYSFDQLRMALEIQFPVQPPADRARPQQPKGAGKQKGQRVHITDAEHSEQSQASQSSDPAVPGRSGEPAGAEQEVESLAEVLSVTAQKLRSFTQARGWMQKGQKGDKDGKGKGKGKTGNHPPKTGTPASSGYRAPYTPAAAPRPMGTSATPAPYRPPAQSHGAPPYRSPLPTTHVSETAPAADAEWAHSLEEYTQEPEQDWYGDGTEMEEQDPYNAYVAYTVPSVMVDRPWHTLWQQQPTPSLVAILDTACQRSVCGKRWLQAAPPSLEMRKQTEREVFKFGVGQDVCIERCAVAVSLSTQAARPDFTTHFSLVNADIPFLWSRQSMETVGLVLDLSTSMATFAKLPGQPRIPLSVINGHLGIRLFVHTPCLEHPDGQNDITIHEHPDGQNDISHAYVAAKPAPVMHPANVTPQYRAAAEALLQFNVPKSSARKHIAEEQTCRSLTFGGYTQRGVGVTAVTRAHPEILQHVLTLAKSRPSHMRMPFLAATLTAHVAAPHRDNNYGLTQQAQGCLW
eukprot:6491396-Amphidinium_carterae.1